jgi:hypothetical protein
MEEKILTEADARKEAEALLDRLKEGMDVYTGKTLLSAAIVGAEARVDELTSLMDKLPLEQQPIVDEAIKWRTMVLGEVMKYKVVA